jgi:hypothetical protein
MLRKTRQALRSVVPGTKVTLSIADRDRSIFQGMGSANMERLAQLGLLDRFALVTDPCQPRATLRKIETTGNSQ